VIARIWHGYTKPEHADAYEAMLKPELLPGIGKAKGYRGSYLLRRRAGDEIEFVTIMLWDSICLLVTCLLAVRPALSSSLARARTRPLGRSLCQTHLLRRDTGA
jgi:hypothetical protein